MSKVKINITLDENLLNDVDDYCDENYMSRSALISMSLVQVINQQKIIDSLRDASIAIKKASEVGHIDEETRKTLEDFQALSRLMAPLK